MNPRRKKSSDFNTKGFKTYYHHSESCVDEITLIKLEDEKVDFVYMATGCAVFLASTDIFLEEASKDNFKNIKTLSLNFKNLINQNKMTDDEFSSLEKLSVFSNVKKHLNRVECALMITKVFEKI